MISSIKIEAFRGVKEGQLDGLGAINILVGPNNSGKSTCLEAVALVGSAGNALEVAELCSTAVDLPTTRLTTRSAPRRERAEITLSFSDGALFQCGLSIGGINNAEHFDRARAEGLKETMKRVAAALARGGNGSLSVPTSMTKREWLRQRSRLVSRSFPSQSSLWTSRRCASLGLLRTRTLRSNG